MPPELKRPITEGSDQPTDFDMKFNGVGSIGGLLEDIETLGKLMGGREKALKAISQAAKIPIKTIRTIIKIPEAFSFSRYRNPLLEGSVDFTNSFPDPNADTEKTVITSISHAELQEMFREATHS